MKVIALSVHSCNSVEAQQSPIRGRISSQKWQSEAGFELQLAEKERAW